MTPALQVTSRKSLAPSQPFYLPILEDMSSVYIFIYEFIDGGIYASNE